MKTIVIGAFLLSLFCYTSCQSNLETESETLAQGHIITQFEKNMSEKYFIVDSTLAIGIGRKIEKHTSVSRNYTPQEKTIKNVISYSRTRGMQPIMYIQNYQNGGFSIISADKRVRPILAYCDKGEFTLENVPVGVQEWINDVSNVIDYFRVNNLEPNPEVTSMWNSVECPEIPERYINCNNPDYSYQTQKGPYLKSKWAQDTDRIQNKDYNKYCPESCPTGCSAIAIGQIMRYWEFPNSYDWSGMSDAIPTDITARFLAELGDKNHLDIDYSIKASSARNTIYDNVLRDFGYNASRVNYDYPKVKNELFSGRPVLLSGKNSNGGGGHVWICDGILIINNATYSSSLLHMNWGWGGSYDGFYLFNDWSFIKNDGSLVDYVPNLFHQMIINISPK